ncbi:unnamed protein product [Merluccius merluccius]
MAESSKGGCVDAWEEMPRYRMREISPVALICVSVWCPGTCDLSPGSLAFAIDLPAQLEASPGSVSKHISSHHTPTTTTEVFKSPPE